MSRLAVLGAGGFIGSRTVELLRAGGHDVLALVRPGSAKRQPGDHPVDARDRDGLAATFKGCEAVVASIAGSTDTIVDVVEPIYSAAMEAGVRRIIHLSSAVVHGQAPLPGTDERARLSPDQPFAYNVAKIQAELRFAELRARHDVEVVMLRPFIVYGPKSRWVRNFADELVAGKAMVFDGGEGICNAVHVDNVVHAIERALISDVPPATAVLLNDAETVRWRDLLEPIAEALGYDFDRIPSRSTEEVIGKLRRPSRWWRRFLGESEEARERRLEAALLQSCAVRLPINRARTVLGYDPPVSFRDGVQQSVAWLAQAGYARR
jgi:nucleoside-diphosphate-sugar epimerase